MLSQHVLRKTRLPRLSSAACRSSFGTTSVNRTKYDATLKNLKIGRHTRVIFQGFTGRQATANAKESIAWGTNIVGGVTPGRESEHLGLPVLPSVRKAVDVLKPHATGIYVAAHQAPAAIEEAIEAEVPLIVAVAEHIPLHDILRVLSPTKHRPIHSILKTQSASRLVGANSPGIISSVGKCRIGFQPLPCFEPGKVGIVAKSGTLSYEAAASTLRAGLGQSLCVGVGGDILSGTGLVDGLKILVEDEETEAIAICGEIGGFAEMEAADWIQEYRSRTRNPKPIAAVIAGVNAVPGRIMGHAGAFALPGEPDASAKSKALEDAGVAVINHPSRFGPVLKTLLSGSQILSGNAIASLKATAPMQQRRTLHTSAVKRPLHRPCPQKVSPKQVTTESRRSLYLSRDVALNLLREQGIDVSETPAKVPDSAQRLLAVLINRATSSPCIIASPTTSDTDVAARSFDFDYPIHGTPDLAPILPKIIKILNLGEDSLPSLSTLIHQLVSLFMSKEAFLLHTLVTAAAPNHNAVKVTHAHLGFDDAALRSGKRQADIHALRDASLEDPAEVSAEPDGIVYIKLGGEKPGTSKSHNIGTLVNGAGLAMNTVDALADAGGKAANFLDTGGKATSETVKRSFEVILQDERVKCIFVNIFGGLTLGDMIARGIVLAFQDLEKQLAKIPVVVRIRGTNEAEGQKIIADSGLSGLYAFDDFDEAAAKAVGLADEKTKEQHTKD
ncbi:succinyl-CoA synthetase alpha subunit [Apiospora rasikravindrae]|uniref:Succinyl-CoA synthetase alpha subunit n=1 Tax=Apiospora rasikravindrae TaxID=990691 RepID=A0ABR1U8S0_9PEZI